LQKSRYKEPAKKTLRGRTGFILFSKLHFEEYSKQVGTARFALVSKVIAKAWKELSEEEREKYSREAKKKWKPNEEEDDDDNDEEQLPNKRAKSKESP